MNRATADNQSAQAQEEGLEPTKEWVKDLVDEILADEFASPDLELTWLDEDTDAKDEQTQFEARVKIGAATLNELRDSLGLDPFDTPAADRPMVLTATGYVPIEANVQEQGASAPHPPANANRQSTSVVQKYGLAQLNGRNENSESERAAAPVVKASADDPEHPGWPAGTPGGLGGKYRPKDSDGGEAPASTVGATDSKPSLPRYTALDTGTRTDASENQGSNGETGDSDEPRVKLAGDWQGLPINLVEEEAPNGIGHAIREHVRKTDIELLEDLERKSYRGPLIDIIDGAEGTFDSIENANDLVNRTLRENSQRVDLVASGKLEDDFIQQRFGFVTGREAFRPDADTEPRIRNTYAVGVFIWHDPHSPRGFRVRTAYPMNQ